MTASPSPRIILASSSPQRIQLMRQLKLTFTHETPDLDETPLPFESPEKMCQRLSEEKACKIAEKHPEAYVIGSDQTASCLGRLLRKPNTLDEARAQLQSIQGKEVDFFTGLCVRNINQQICLSTYVLIQTKIRQLDNTIIENYILNDHPLGCLGSIRTESLGIALMERITTHDPSAIVGMPLISLVGFLIQCGISFIPLSN